MGPKRVRDPGIAFDNLTKIDVVLISDNHYDHFNVESFKKLNQNHHYPFIIPLNIAKILKKLELSILLRWIGGRHTNYHPTIRSHSSYGHHIQKLGEKLDIILGSKLSIGMHFGTFHLSVEEYYKPVQRLNSKLIKYHINHENFIAP